MAQAQQTYLVSQSRIEWLAKETLTQWREDGATQEDLLKLVEAMRQILTQEARG